MTLEEIQTGLEATGYQVAYHHFSKPTALPYIVYLTPEHTTMYADNASYLEKMRVRIELYTDTKDLQAEKRIREAMSTIGLNARHDGEVYIDSEKMYLNAYESEVI